MPKLRRTVGLSVGHAAVRPDGDAGGLCARAGRLCPAAARRPGPIRCCGRWWRSAAVLLATGVPYPTYFAGAQFIHFLLGPAVVALAWPLWQRRVELRARLGRLLLAALAGGAAASGSRCARLGARPAARRDAVAGAQVGHRAGGHGHCRKIGGMPALAAVFAVLTGHGRRLSGKYLFDLAHRLPTVRAGRRAASRWARRRTASARRARCRSMPTQALTPAWRWACRWCWHRC